METPDPENPKSKPGVIAPYAAALHHIKDKDAWRKFYRETVEELERIRAQELAAMTEEEALRIIQSLGVCETPWRERPDWSGLVEQQALFQKGRKK